ncbi:DNA-binding domain-containing protein [Sneathiella marina]|uniref:DNA-binding domain-containing protein n=1 Tax=Sneathiella marina TaxID=2950108 RepID=A0ABY4WBB7_9PROT|nr:DNA-binding domain-containing protein [Sneathiella marina]USG62554.1 DNA-binding domain-containing protein [Sneathiella marina]
MSINHLQKSFSGALLNPENLLPTEIMVRDGIDIAKRFSVYQNNVVSSLITALKTAFPTVLKIVGDEFFSAMAAVFVRKYPPKSPVLMLYGDMFPDFLSKFEPVADLHYLPEVAYLEQLRRQVYHAADKDSVSQLAFAEISEAEFQSLVLSIHPASAFAVFKYPVASIWHWNNAETAAVKPEIPSNGEEVLVWRLENDVRMRLLSVGTVSFIRNLQCKLSLGESAERASEIEGFDLTSAIAALIETGLVTAINRG